MENEESPQIPSNGVAPLLVLWMWSYPVYLIWLVLAPGTPEMKDLSRVLMYLLCTCLCGIGTGFFHTRTHKYGEWLALPFLGGLLYLWAQLVIEGVRLYDGIIPSLLDPRVWIWMSTASIVAVMHWWGWFHLLRFYKISLGLRLPRRRRCR